MYLLGRGAICAHGRIEYRYRVGARVGLVGVPEEAESGPGERREPEFVPSVPRRTCRGR